MISIWLYGVGGHAKVVADVLTACNIKVAGVLDDNPELMGQCEWDALPGIRLAKPGEFKTPSGAMILTIGNNQIRSQLAQDLDTKFAQAIHPSAAISPSASIGEGTVVFHQAVVQAGSKIGKHVIINTCASIDHDNLIEDFAHVSPNATLCGGVHIGKGTHVGAGAVIIEGVSVGQWSTIGAGAVVIRDVPDFTTVVGNPARPIRNSTSPSMSDPSIELNQLLTIVNSIRKVAGRVDLEQLLPEQKLQQDLELDSLELAEMTVLIESKFGVDVFDQGIATTVHDVVTRIQNR